jgi:hypothetical protein
MSNFLILKELCDKLESMMCNFWWGSNVDKRKIHWVNWKKKHANRRHKVAWDLGTSEPSMRPCWQSKDGGF